MYSPSFRPQSVGGVDFTAAQPPPRREIVDESDIDPDFTPKAPDTYVPGGGKSAPPPERVPPVGQGFARRSEIHDPDNIDPDFR